MGALGTLGALGEVCRSLGRGAAAWAGIFCAGWIIGGEGGEGLAGDDMAVDAIRIVTGGAESGGGTLGLRASSPASTPWNSTVPAMPTVDSRRPARLGAGGGGRS